MLRDMSTFVAAEEWPALPIESWEDTRATIHMWTQVVGKVCLALTPLTNHFWNIAFHLTPRGLVTPPMTVDGGTFTITFDFVAHQLVFECSDGRMKTNPLRPQTVADFYKETMATLQEMGIEVRIWPMPVEVPNPIRFTEDVVHHSYDPVWANAFWRAVLAMKPVFRSEEHTSELQSRRDLVCRLLLEKKKARIGQSIVVLIVVARRQTAIL